MRKILALEQQGLACGLGEGVGEAVAQIQAGRAAAVAPVGSLGAPRETGLPGGHGLDRDSRKADQIIKASAAIGSAPMSTRFAASTKSTADSFGVALPARLGEQDTEKGRAVDDHRGSPTSSYSRSP